MEDYTTYTEEEPDDRIQKTAQHIDHYAWRNEDSWLVKDKGAAHFSDFIHCVNVKINSSGAVIGAWGAAWALSTDIDDILGLKTTGKTCIAVNTYYSSAGGNPKRIQLYEMYNYNAYYDECNISFDTWYYLKIVKSGTSLLCGIYSTSLLRNAGDGSDGDVGNLSLTLQADHSFRYVFGCNTYNSNDSLALNNDIENLDLNEEEGPSAGWRCNYKIIIGGNP